MTGERDTTVVRSELHEKYGIEEVVVIPAECVKGCPEPFEATAIRDENGEICDFDWQGFHAQFRPMLRADAEYNHEVRQIIPYVVVANGEGQSMKVFGYRRLDKSGEGRLVGKLSIGIGGHLTRKDMQEYIEYLRLVMTIPELRDRYNPNHTGCWVGAMREFEEELGKDASSKIGNFQNIGFLNDKSDDVGRDHFGVVYMFHMNNEDIAVAEPENIEGRWYTVEELTEAYYEMENWSQILMDYVIMELVRRDSDNAN